ncbi:hypothetical protein Trydic_g21457 [Trypoxylus dichotomus]
MALRFSTGPNAYSVWSRSTHAARVGVSLTLPISRLQQPKFSEEFKQTFDNRYLFFDFQHGSRNLKSRRRFLAEPLDEPSANYPLSESPLCGISYSFGTWRMSNNIRTGVASVKVNLIRWGLAQRSAPTVPQYAPSTIYGRAALEALDDLERLIYLGNQKVKQVKSVLTDENMSLRMSKYYSGNYGI